MSLKEFIDMCILLGCDFCPKINGIGPKSAPDLIREHKTIETVIKSLDQNKFQIPKNFFFDKARKEFLNPQVIPADKLKTNWTTPDESGLIRHLTSIGMTENTAEKNVKKLINHFGVYFSKFFGLNGLVIIM
jgi:flap endonuclease-1